jgi:hypothetical protein
VGTGAPGGGGGSFTRRSRQPGPHPGNPRAKGEKEESGKRFQDLGDVAKLVSGPGLVDILRLLLTTTSLFPIIIFKKLAKFRQKAKKKKNKKNSKTKKK